MRRTVLALVCVVGLVGCVSSTEDAASSDDGLTAAQRQKAQAEAVHRTEVCFQHDWSTFAFRTTPLDELHHPDRDPLLWSIEELMTAQHGMIFDAQRLVSYFDEGTTSLRDLGARLRQVRDRQHLNQHQTAMLTTCVSSEYLTYAEHEGMFGDAEVLARRAGVCQDFALIGSRLLREVGLGSWVQASIDANHAWVEIELTETGHAGRYYLEPQANPLTTQYFFMRKP